MKKIIDIFTEKDKTFSLELFPPKTEQGFNNLLETIKSLSTLKPDFISCTYGAGGGNREKTFDIVELIQKKYNIISLAHLTCVLNSKNDIKAILNDVKSRGINNVLALRGDPPLDNPNWQPGVENFKYSKDLCAFIKKNFPDYFCIGVAGFPEGHSLCPDKELDADYLKQKFDNGADFVITQLFLDNNLYFKYIERLRKRNVKTRVLPGILPITSYEGLVKFCTKDKITIPQAVKKIFEPIAEDKEATLKAGIDFAIKQCKELLKGGAPGIHLYSLNKVHPTNTILSSIK